ncbi:SipW-dependent-type signal peptide-containing protein [Arthrobacter sp. NPDC056727]|uniref:SipW-dependent-type signal peptide-containing protein n=1 Tax=Arthrobacter sp. NPDC056727 TaxID=3345927 RepID=UPI00366D85B5
MSTTEFIPAQTPPSSDKSKRRKAKAILAGGLVLGIGAAVTLAAWNDSEFVKGAFGSGHLNIEGRADAGTAFADHGTSAAALSFTTDFGNMSPGDIVVMPYAVRLDRASTYDASVTVNKPNTAGGDNAKGNLSYRVVTVDSFADCQPGATGSVVVEGASLNSAETLAAFDLNKAADAQTDAVEQHLCIQVTAGNGLQQDQSVTATWEFVATTS